MGVTPDFNYTFAPLKANTTYYIFYMYSSDDPFETV